MDLGWFQSILYGLFAGLAEILPVSARAHSIILLKVFGKSSPDRLSVLMIHLAILIALYYSSQVQIIRVSRALSLARVPKKRRKRPLDTKSLMDFKLWRTIIVPVILGYLLYNKIAPVEKKLILISVFLFVNGVILYIPQFLPSSNRDSRTLSRVDGLLMGLGGALSVLPGISGIGTSVSIGSVRGADRTYALNLSLLMSCVICICLIAYDVSAIISYGLDTVAFLDVIKYVFSSFAAFVGAILGIRIMRIMANNSGFYAFSYYCWGLALFTFILNLMA